MGLFIGEYIFASGTAPSLDVVFQRLSARSGLEVRRRASSSFDGSTGFVLSRLGEGASLKQTTEGWYVEYDRFPPTPPFASWGPLANETRPAPGLLRRHCGRGNCCRGGKSGSTAPR